MANPQTENGSTMIANELLEKLYSFPFTAREFKVIFFVIRKTWGWHKTEDHISYTQVADACSITRRNAIYTVNSLVSKQALVITKGYINTIKFNTDYEKWVVPEITPLVSEQALPSVGTSTRVVSEQALKLVPNPTPTKERNIILQNKLIQKKEKKIFSPPNLEDSDFLFIAEKYQVPIAFVKSKYDDMLLWIESRPDNPKLKGRDWNKTLMKFVKDDAVKIFEKQKGDPTRRVVDARSL